MLSFVKVKELFESDLKEYIENNNCSRKSALIKFRSVLSNWLIFVNYYSNNAESIEKELRLYITKELN